jgi:hypothetical protein
MNCRRWIAAIAATTLIAGQGEQTALAANDKTQPACAAAALTDYTRATVALMQQSPILSVEATISKRRLEEQYCLRSTRCLMGEATNAATGMAFAAKFSTCLREEALENSK